MKTTRKRPALLLLAVLAIPNLLKVASAFADSAFRAGPGIQVTTSAALPTTIAGRRTLWVRTSDDALMYYNGASSVALGGSTGNWTFTGDAADDVGAAVLTIGATTATGVTIGRTAGAVTLAADTTLASGKTITGAAAADLQLNAVTGQQVRLRVNGTNVLSASGTTVTVSGDLQMGSGKHIYGGAGVSAADFSTGSGIFKTTTGAATFGGSSNTFTNGIIAPSLVTGDASDLGLGVNSLTRLYLGTSATVASATLTGRDNTWGSTESITGYSGVRVEAATVTVTDGVITAPHLATLSVSNIPTIVEQNDGVFSSTSIPYAFWVEAGGAAFTREDTGVTVGTVGATLDNTTDATAGNQKYSPALVWRGNGWKTDATAASRSVRVAAQLVPIEGTANPDGALIFYKSINGGGWAQTEVNGAGYFGSNDAQALGTATTSSTTFVDVGNGSSTGFASWTAPTTKVTKTFTLHVVVRSYMGTLGSSVTTYFQVLQDGVAISGQPTATASQAFGTTSQYLQTTWRIAVPCTAGSAHVYKLQWKVGNASDSAGVTATAGTLQYYITG